MSADIEKLATVDGRVVQSRPKYAVEKGALSLTNAPFRAISATTSQHTYNVYVPSENVYVDRRLLWSSTVYQSFLVSLAAVPVSGDSVIVPGRDFSLCSFPLNSAVATMSATINDTTTTQNSQDVMREVMRLTDYKHNRLVRTCPTMLDKYASYNDAFATANNPIGGYDAATDYDNIPNGAWNCLVFTDPAGGPLSTAALPFAYSPAYGGGVLGLPYAPYTSVGGVPTVPPVWNAGIAYPVGSVVVSAGSIWNATAAAAIGVAPVAPAWTQTQFTALPIFVRWQTAEPLILSPFVFSDTHEYDTGLFGISNIQLVMNLQTSSSRLIRSCSRAGRTISAVQYNTGASGGAFQNSVLNVQFLTPPLDVPLPPKSVVPYMEFPRYITTAATQLQPNEVSQVPSQTITLPQIPDLLIIYAKAVETPAQTDGDAYFAIDSPATNAGGGSVSPLSVNFDNFSGLLSSHTTEELYAMSVKNGLDMDWDSWSGLARSAGGSYGTRQQGQRVPTVGSILVLKPSQDITLQSGQAPSLVGNFTFQFNISLRNTRDVALTPQLYVITANSGFFESIRGSSRVIKGVLSEQDIISAPMAPAGLRASLGRMVGGLSFGSLANVLSKAKDIYEASKPVGSMVKKGLEIAGYGGTGAGTGAGAGAGRSKKGLMARLM